MRKLLYFCIGFKQIFICKYKYNFDMGKKITPKEKEKVVRLLTKHTSAGDNITTAYKKTVIATGISEPSIITIWKEYTEQTNA